jgi:DNA-binding NarL/FixJ family response regulator
MSQILVVDDQPYMRKILCDLIEGQDGWAICGEAADGREAVEQARLLRADVIVMDVRMPGLDGFQATNEILLHLPRARILIVSVENLVHFSKTAESSGARGYMAKSSAGRNLIPAVSALLRDETYFAH